MMPQDHPDHDKALRWSRRLSFVPRWGVLPTIRKQNVAEHCFHVGRTVLWLYQFVDTEKQWSLLSALELALCHDDDEAATGDHPSPTKKPRDVDFMSTAELIVKVADILEMMAFVHEEIHMGNDHGTHIVKSDLIAKLDAYWAKFPWAGTDKPHSIVVRYLDQIVSAKYPHPVLEFLDERT